MSEAFDDLDSQAEGSIQIHQYIKAEMSKRENSSEIDRASSAPSCVKKRWYQGRGEPGEELQPRSVLVFAVGDVTEHVMKNFIERACVGPGKLYSEVDFGKKTGKFIIQHREFDTYEQEKLIIPINETLTVSGHPDGWGKRNRDGQWELVEVKSAASYGFDEFKSGTTPDYIRQVHAMMMSTKAKDRLVRRARFFYMNKNTQHLHDRVYDFDDNVAAQVKAEYIMARSETEPRRPYEYIEETYYKKPTGRMVLGYPCGYCGYKLKCFPDVKMEVSKSGKPVWVKG